MSRLPIGLRVRKTDYRPAETAWDGYAQREKEQAARHDAVVRDLPTEVVILALGDLCKGAYDPTDKALCRWERHRKAALLRRCTRENLIPFHT